MLRHVPEPFHTRWLEAHVGVEASADGAVDYGLPLLLQQLDRLLLSSDVASDPSVRVVEQANNCELLVDWWHENPEFEEIVRSQGRSHSGTELVVDCALVQVVVLAEEVI